MFALAVIVFSLVASVEATTKFALKKRDNKEFVSRIKARAQSGLRCDDFYIFTINHCFVYL